MRLPSERDETPKYIWNPLTEDFTVQMADDKNKPQFYIARAQEISTFPAYIARHVARHLAQHITLKRTVKTNYQDEYNKVMEEITKFGTD